MTDLSTRGAARVEWIRSRMPLLARTREDFATTRPFDGHRIGMSLHIEPKTAVLLETLAAGGAELVVTGNHGSTQDDVVAYLRTLGMTVFGSRDDDLTQHHRNVASVAEAKPTILLDNGADLAALVAAEVSRLDSLDDRSSTNVIGGTEETTSGGIRLRDELAGS
ncbi:MAG: adenosylhomocysteinase, partial [Rhodoglobus sp.]